MSFQRPWSPLLPICFSFVLSSMNVNQVNFWTSSRWSEMSDGLSVVLRLEIWTVRLLAHFHQLKASYRGAKGPAHLRIWPIYTVFHTRNTTILLLIRQKEHLKVVPRPIETTYFGHWVLALRPTATRLERSVPNDKVVKVTSNFIFRLL